MANIQKRGDNSWYFTVSLGKGPDNKYDRRTKTYTVTEKMTPKELREHLDYEFAKFKIEVESGSYIAPGRKTFTEFIVMWRENYAKSNLSPTTQDVYNVHIETRLIPTFGHTYLEQIKAGSILDFLKGLEKPGARMIGGIESEQKHVNNDKTAEQAKREAQQKPLDIKKK